MSTLKVDNDHMYSDPSTFIDTLNSDKHLVLFYEDDKDGKKMRYRFIRNGLLKGENCIYTTHNDNLALIENEMESNDIDVRV